MAGAKERAASLERQLKSVGPQRVLDRGYSYTLGADGKVLRSPSQVAQGETITTVLAEGKLKSKVEGSASSGPASPKPKKIKGDRAEGGGLFDGAEAE